MSPAGWVPSSASETEKFRRHIEAISPDHNVYQMSEYSASDKCYACLGGCLRPDETCDYSSAVTGEKVPPMNCLSSGGRLCNGEQSGESTTATPTQEPTAEPKELETVGGGEYINDEWVPAGQDKPETSQDNGQDQPMNTQDKRQDQTMNTQDNGQDEKMNTEDKEKDKDEDKEAP